jgi:hypothetical protein
MGLSRRELVLETLEFRNASNRAPRDLWTLPWAEFNHGDELRAILADYPPDIVQTPPEFKRYKTAPISVGDAYEIGEYTDEWGVVWNNAERGHVGEVKAPIIPPGDDGWADTSRVHFPEELLTIDVNRVNEFCDSTDQFVLSSDLARPFERMQFIRGTEQLFVDLALENRDMLAMLERVHDFNCRLLEVWATTKVDGLFAMDDWGTQRSLLIDPAVWKARFKPLYRDYVDIAHRRGKKMFFHSDGNTLAIIPELIDLGFDAANLQIFAIGVENLAQFKGKITFWGEMDRQHLLPHGSAREIDDAVRKVFDTVWRDGGAIGQCEFGPGANPANVRQLFASWNALR